MGNKLKKFFNLLFEQDNSVIRASVVAVILSLSIFNLVWPLFDALIATGEFNYNIFETDQEKEQDEFKEKLQYLKNFADTEYQIETSNNKISKHSIRCYSLDFLKKEGRAPKKEFKNYKGSIEINCLHETCTYRLWLSNDKYGINDMNYDEINMLKFEKGIKANNKCGK